MNTFCGVGRLCADPELKSIPSGKLVVNGTLAIQRTKDQADFIPFAAWEKTAELLSKHCAKGQMIGVEGMLQSRKYEYEGKTRVDYCVLVNRLTFCGDKRQAGDATNAGPTASTGAPVASQDDPFGDQ